MTKTIDVIVDGETIDIEVEELSSLEIMRLSAKAPTELQEQPDEIESTPDIVEFMIDVVTSQTILTEELLEEIEPVELSRLMSGVVEIAFGEEPNLNRDESDFKRGTGIKFNDDGSVDLDEWQ